MLLKSVVFYQSVTLWDKSENKTVLSTLHLSIDLKDHLIRMTHTDHKEVIIVPTANMRQGIEHPDFLHLGLEAPLEKLKEAHAKAVSLPPIFQADKYPEHPMEDLPAKKKEKKSKK
jgi:hypothetical protein